MQGHRRASAEHRSREQGGVKRALILSITGLLLATVAVVYSVRASRPAPQAATADVSVGNGQLLFRDSSGQVATVPRTAPADPRSLTGLTCQRVSIAASTTVCLVAEPGLLPKTSAVLLDHRLQETRRFNLAGVPSRARVSASGNMVSWTVFVTGDSYNAGGFSTWTGIFDSRTGYLIANMETLQLYRDGQRYHSADVNYWGVTFAADDNRFYATVSTRGETYLIEGDYAKWQGRILRSNVECPSLSPDGKRLVFKKRVSSTAWRLHALDLETMRETPLAETASIDDQVVWLDANTVMYAKKSDVWAVPADGTGAPRMLIANASTPSGVDA